MGIFSVGISGLNAAQVGILTTSHNIANASTAGYTRQQIVQSTNNPLFTGSGYVGQGTNVRTVERIYSQQLNSQMLSAQTGAAAMDAYLTQIQQIDNLLADSQAGLSPALSGFFSAVQEAAANPSSLPARQGMLSASQTMIGRFQSLDERLSQIRSGVETQISSLADEISTYARQIADINQRILSAEAAGLNQAPNDLMDQRDQLIADLNQKVRVSTLAQDDGTYNVFVGNGQPLVVGATAYGMKAEALPEDPTRLELALVSPSGTTINLPESMLTGGTLGGVLAFRSESLDAAQNALGRIALTLASNFNEQHKLGQDLTGGLGGDYFDMSQMLNQPMASDDNLGTGAITLSIDAATVNKLTTSDYQITYDGTNTTLVRLSDNASTLITSSPQVVDGLSIDISGWSPVAGDSFLLQPTRGGASGLALAIADTREIALAAPIRTATPLTNTGTASISAGSVSATTSLPLASNVTLTYNSATQTFSATGGITAGPFAYTSGQPLSFNGLSVTISGNPANGDKFTIGNNTNGVADNRNGVLLGALQTRTTMVDGGSTYQSAYSAIVSQIGNKTHEVEVTGEAQQAFYDQAKVSRDGLSGVNLDEEAANLLRYQQAYQAAAKMIDVAGKLFDEILALN